MAKKRIDLPIMDIEFCSETALDYPFNLIPEEVKYLILNKSHGYWLKLRLVSEFPKTLQPLGIFSKY